MSSPPKDDDDPSSPALRRSHGGRRLPSSRSALASSGFGFDDDGVDGGGPGGLTRGRSSAVAQYRGDARGGRAPFPGRGRPAGESSSSSSRRGRIKGRRSRRGDDAFPAGGTVTLPVVLNLGVEKDDDDEEAEGTGGGTATVSIDRPTVSYAFVVPPRHGGRWGGTFGYRGGARGKNAWGGGRVTLEYDVNERWGMDFGVGIGGDRRELSLGTTLQTDRIGTVRGVPSACTYRAALTKSPGGGASAPALSLSADRPLNAAKGARLRGMAACKLGLPVLSGSSASGRSDATFHFARLALYSSSGSDAEYADVVAAGGPLGGGPTGKAGPTAAMLALDLGLDRRPVKAYLRRDLSSRRRPSGGSKIGYGNGGDDGDGAQAAGDLAVDASLEWGGLNRSYYYPPRWSVLLRRALSDRAAFGVGLRHPGGEMGLGLAWLLRFERGEVRMDVPIVFATAAAASGKGGGAAAWAATLRGAYLTLLSGLVDAAVADLLGAVPALARALGGGGTGGGGDYAEDAAAPSAARLRAARLLRQSKARSDAERQALLMSRRAESNRRAEETRGGLVILKATYGIVGGAEEEESRRPTRRRKRRLLDVTRQLQFWVADSALRLPPSSKRNLLGFYDVTVDADADDEDEDEDKKKGEGERGEDDSKEGDVSQCRPRRRLSWRELWGMLASSPLWRSEDKGNSDSGRPVLAVTYKFEGSTYTIRVGDEDALLLPNPRARRVTVASE